MNLLASTLFFLAIVGAVLPVYADVQNIQVFQDGKSLTVAGNPALLEVRPNSFLFGSLDSSNYPNIVCQLENCLYQIESQGYENYHVKFSGLALNDSAIVKIGDFSIVFQPKQEVKQQVIPDPSWNVQIPNWAYLGAVIGAGLVAVVIWKVRGTETRIL